MESVEMCGMQTKKTGNNSPCNRQKIKIEMISLHGTDRVIPVIS